MARTVIVGDVHGCAGELEALLDEGGVRRRDDRLVMVGDLVVRGPDPHGDARRSRQRMGARAVRGNHEEKLLGWRNRHKPLGPDHERTARVLADGDWRCSRRCRSGSICRSTASASCTRASSPGVPIEQQPPEALLRMRTLDATGRWSDDGDAGELWGTRYAGPPHIVFGHNARHGTADPPVGDGARHGLRLRRPAHRDGPRREGAHPAGRGARGSS